MVVTHIESAEPVGSGQVARRFRLGVSSATIRSEMSALEDLGFLVQPHTSAGRVPTDLGYRFYVDTLPEPSRLPDGVREAIRRFFASAPDMEETIRGTTRLLSTLTHHAALALAPSIRESRISVLDLVGTGSVWLLVVVTETGAVEKRVLEPGAVSGRAAERLRRDLNEGFRGLTLAGAAARADALAGAAAEAARDEERRLLEAVAAALHPVRRDERVIVGGAANIVGEEGFDRRDTIEGVIRALEEEAQFLTMLRAAATSGDLTVTIGRENPVTAMREASIVIAPYGPDDRTLGTVGVVGPTRMDYQSAIAAVQAVAERLSRVLQALAR